MKPDVLLFTPIEQALTALRELNYKGQYLVLEQDGGISLCYLRNDFGYTVERSQVDGYRFYDPMESHTVEPELVVGVALIPHGVLKQEDSNDR